MTHVGTQRLLTKKIPATAAQWMTRMMQSRDYSLKKILVGTGIGEEWVQNTEATITPAKYLKLIANALNASDNPALGLSMGEVNILNEMGFWGYAIMSSPTLGEAADVASQFWSINGNLVDVFVKGDSDIQIWEILPAFPFQDICLWIFAVEEMVSTFYSSACFMANRIVPFEEIRLSYSEPDHGSLYRELFKCPVYFNEPIDSIFFSKKYLDIPIMMSHEQVAEVCIKQCEEMAVRLGRKDELIESIKQIIASSSFKTTQLDEVAVSIQIGKRTLQRKLRSLNTTFQEVLDETRSDFTKTYLLNTNLSVEQIADRIGFSEVTNFRHAFKRWTGMTIRAFKDGMTSSR